MTADVVILYHVSEYSDAGASMEVRASEHAMISGKPCRNMLARTPAE
jgi:hypothetical protein